MSLRLKLLLLGLATLVLPWAGCRYAREMESALREGEQTSLESVAETLAASLQGRADLLYRAPAGPSADTPATPADTAADAPAGASATAPASWAPPKAGPDDLEPLVLPAAPLIDGYADDWPRDPAAWVWYAHDAQHRFGVLTGVFERMLYVLIDVHDAHPVFDAPGMSPLDPAAMGDRVWIGFEDPQGEERQVFLAATGPGSVAARDIVQGEYGQLLARLEPRIRAAWQLSASGYRLELRVPLSMLGAGFGVLVDDRDRRGADPLSYGSLRAEDLHTLGRLIVASPDLETYLAQFAQPGLRLTVLGPSGRVLARVDALGRVETLAPPPPLLARLYRRFVDRPGAHALIETRSSIYDRDHRAVIGALEVTQTADRWVPLRDRALTRMLNFTLTTSLVAVIVMFAFAAWLALRLSRLRQASESALTRAGLITSFPDTDARDELGDVARSFSTLLGRLNEYTGYLRTLAGKLAHEIRTPLTIVRSSLDNLEAEPVSPAAHAYLERARQGSERLNAILLAMGAATRVEEAISAAERSRIDLVPLIASAVGAYRGAFPGRSFAADLPSEGVVIEGAADLIVQLLDKLIENAVDFSPPGATITVRLLPVSGAAVLEVDNPGPPLPARAEGQMFESLWQSRTGSDSRPHFGLGLYIVRLIAEFHGGAASAANLPAGDGVRFVVRLPR
ncbi:MAG TPA: ATP-binding protein [Steroidobacteraceae bacterium]|nr:ATP-binding protein [Steroidobacteraceae bacterium]